MQVGTVYIDHTINIKHDDVLFLHPKVQVHFYAGNCCCTGSAYHHLYFGGFFLNDLQGIQ
ncbi:hypothetical protein D3C80_2129090 [compost metagenome]